jgi:hypothetical protein
LSWRDYKNVSVERALTRIKGDRAHRMVKFRYGEVVHDHASVFTDDATTNRELIDESQEGCTSSHQHRDIRPGSRVLTPPIIGTGRRDGQLCRHNAEQSGASEGKTAEHGQFFGVEGMCKDRGHSEF